MKKLKLKTLIGISICLLLAIAFALPFTGCGETVDEPLPTLVKHTVTVTGGNGGGEFKTNAACTVTAEVPDGKMFAKWTVNGEEVSRDNPYTFTVTEDTDIAAVVDVAYTVMVDGGKIGDTTEIETKTVKGETVTVKARSTAAKTFLYWLVDGSETKIEANPYSFAVNSDVTIRAVFDETLLISVANGTVYGEGKPEDATRSMRVKAGDACTVIANDAPAGQKFAYWYYLDENRNEAVLSETREYTFTATQSRKIYAKFDFYYTVTVKGGYIGGDKTVSVAEIWEDEEITVTAIIPADKGFVAWNVNGEAVGTHYAYTFRVTEDVTLVAEFADNIKLTAPKNDANQMFVKKSSGYSDMIVELDRQKDGNGGRVTAFTEGVDCVVYYIYTSTDAAKTDYVGRFVLRQTNGTSAEIQQLDGSLGIGVGSTPGDYYFDRVSNADFFGFIAAAVGDGYSAEQSYFLAAQAKAATNSIYLDSEISEIGTSVIRERA